MSAPPKWPKRHTAAAPVIGIYPEHRIAAGDERAPGVTPRCREIWAKTRNFTTAPNAIPSNPNASRWWADAWERFHAACDGGAK